MILISYPAGGFGNFLYHCLTEFSDRTYKPNNTNFSFNDLGNSHSTKKYVPVYYHDPDNYQLTLPDTDLECLVLCDNGINNDSYQKINKTFPDAVIVRAVIDPAIRPVIYKTCVIKAQNSNVVSKTKDQVAEHWTDTDNYAIRENFTLLYHNWPFRWNEDHACVNVHLEQLINNPAKTIHNLIVQTGGKTINLDGLDAVCAEWIRSNAQYFKIYHDWQKIELALDSGQSIDIGDIVDLHDQGYLNYCIERKFHVTIPVYDYRNWFATTKQIQEMIQCLK
jgi:hypothetical protein